MDNGQLKVSALRIYNKIIGKADTTIVNCPLRSVKFQLMLIGLTQHTTRCSYRPCQAHKNLVTSHTAVEAEAVFIQICL